MGMCVSLGARKMSEHNSQSDLIGKRKPKQHLLTSS